MLKKLDTKTSIILILTVLVLVLGFMTTKNNVSYHKSEIKALKEENRALKLKYDSLSIENKKIDAELEKIYGVIKITEKLVIMYDNKIKDLKDRQNETSNRVNVLNANGVAAEFTNYIKKRGGKNIRR